MPDFADKLIAELDSAPCWPLPREEAARRKVENRRAFRKKDVNRLKQLADWGRWDRAGVERDYLADPLPKQMAVAFADFLYGEDPRYLAPDGANQDDLDEAVEGTDLTKGLRRGVRLSVSEGEVWFKLHVNREIADYALVDWVSRLHVVPLFYGDRVLACGFVREVAREENVRPGARKDEPEVETIVWRHVEIYCDKRVVNVLYRGDEDSLGKRHDLTARPETGPEEMAEEWNHGLPMLAGRVVNDLDDDADLGESDYDQVQDELLALNEAITISSENARLTGKDRVFTSRKFLQMDGSLDASVDVFQVEDADGGTMGETSSGPPVVAIEKRYDAIPLWIHIEKLTKLIMNRVGLVQQWVGEDVDGSGDSGLAIRLRFIPTVNAAEGKAREWDPTVPKILDRILRIGALAVVDGGFGKAYTPTDPAALPSVERTDPIPADEGEVITQNSLAVTAGIRARRTAIAAQHPDWDEEKIDKEVAAIAADMSIDPPEDPADPDPPPDPEPQA